MGYWSKVTQRAWQETKPWLGLAAPRANLRFIGATLILTAGVAAALIAADRVARQHWYAAVVVALAASVLVIWLLNFLRAPQHLLREAEARIAALSTPADTRSNSQDEIDALQSAYAAGRELFRMKDMFAADEMKLRVDEWFVGTAELVKRIGSKNEAFTFATAADFAAVPGGDKAPSGLLLTRLAKLKQIIDRMVQQKEGGSRVPGMRRPADEG